MAKQKVVPIPEDISNEFNLGYCYEIKATHLGRDQKVVVVYEGHVPSKVGEDMHIFRSVVSGRPITYTDRQLCGEDIVSV